MMKKFIYLFFVLITVSVCFAGEKYLYTTDDLDLGSQLDNPRNNIESSVGVEFTIGQFDRYVDTVGFYDWDQNGLDESHRVAVWHIDDVNLGEELLLATVPAGTGAELTDNFRWVPLSNGAVRLKAGETYLLRGEIFIGGDQWLTLEPGAGLRWPLPEFWVGTQDHYCTWNNTGEWGTGTISGGSASAWTYDYLYGAANFRTVVVARDPSPESGPDVFAGEPDDLNPGKVKVTLSWSTAMDPCDINNLDPNITNHVLYISDTNDFNDPVALVSAGSPVQPTASYVLRNLDFGQQVYWRVDEQLDNLDANDMNNVIPGEIWDFNAVTDEPTILEQPEDLLVVDGDSATFSCSASSASPITYTWYKSADDVIDGGDTLLASGPDPNYTIAVTDQDTDDAWYYCEVSTGGTPDYTDVVHLWFERLIGNWKMNDDLTDSTSLGWDGSQGPVTSSFDPCAIEGTKSLSSPDDPDGYIQIADSNAYYNHYPLGLTANAWVRVDTMSNWGAILSKNAADAGWQLGCDWIGRPYFAIGSALKVEAASVESPVEVDDNAWHMITGTYDPSAGKGRLYVDGVLILEADQASAPVKNDGDAAIAIDSLDGKARPWAGLIDDARVYTYPMAQEDIIDMYAAYVPDVGAICLDNEVFDSDLTDDCQVNMEDLGVLAGEWLDCNLYPASECSE